MSAECLVFDTIVDHPRVTLWQVLAEPELYPRFFRGVSCCERIDPAEGRRSVRYRVRAAFADGPLEHQLETMINRPPEQLVFASVPDTGGWVSVRLSDAGPGRTQVKFVFFKPSLPHPRWSRGGGGPLQGVGMSLRDAAIRAWARDGLQRISDHLGRVPGPLTDRREAMVSQWQVARTLISAGVLAPTRPDKAIRQLRALAQWGGTLAGGYTAAAARAPDELAMIDQVGVRTFGQLDDRTTRLANGLRALEITRDTKVGVLARNSSGMVESLIACSKLGVDVVLLNTGMSANQIEDIVRRHGIGVVLADDDLDQLIRYLPDEVRRVSTAARLGELDRPTIDDLIIREPPTRITPPDRPGRLIVLTSGTTGTPKGARRPTPKGLAEAASMLSRIPLHVGERMLIAAPIFHSWGLAALQIGMPLRASLVLRSRFDAEDCLRTIAQRRCTALFAVPIMLQRILNLPESVRARYDTSSLRIVASSGSALSGALVTGFMDAFGDILYNFYGSTEVSWATVADPADLRAAPTTAGRPPLGTRVGILGSGGDPVPHGVIGRIFVGNDMLFDGYTDGAAKDVKHAMMDTGDRGYLDADGRLFISGRDDEMIISGGENVFPRPVEEALAALPHVEEVAVVGVPDTEYGQRLAAYVVLKDGARLDADAVRAYVHQRLARFSVPRDVIFTEELPRNPTGKILKRLLVEGEWLEEQNCS